MGHLEVGSLADLGSRGSRRWTLLRWVGARSMSVMLTLSYGNADAVWSEATLLCEVRYDCLSGVFSNSSSASSSTVGWCAVTHSLYSELDEVLAIELLSTSPAPLETLSCAASFDSSHFRYSESEEALAIEFLLASSALVELLPYATSFSSSHFRYSESEEALAIEFLLASSGTLKKYSCAASFSSRYFL